MPWQDRKLQAAYTSPSGIRFEFLYEDFSVSVDKKTTTFIFPDFDGAYIQDLGRAGRNYPFTLYFSGENYDQLADAFLAALEEKGIGTLEHPRYGTKYVVPTGTINLGESHTNGANQATFGVTFSETITDLTIPAIAKSATDEIDAAINSFQEQQATEFTESVAFETASGPALVENELTEQATTMRETFTDLAAQVQEIATEFNQVVTAFENNIDNLVSDVNGVINQAITVVRTPARLQASMESKFDAYKSVIDNSTGTLYEDTLGGNDADVYKTASNFVMSAMASICESSIYSLFDNRPQAINISARLLDLYDEIILWQDTNAQTLGIIDTGDGYTALSEVISRTVSYLITIAFDLPAEKFITLGEDRQILELVSELYGDLDEIDKFITDNDLTADEIELLERGKVLRYYE